MGKKKTNLTLEEQFEEACKTGLKQINAKLKEAEKALDEAVQLAESFGIPFDAQVSPLFQTYKPRSFEKKFPDLDPEFVADLTGAYWEWDGWQHSAVC